MLRKCIFVITAFIFLNVFAAEASEANGTLRVAFKYKNPDGTEQALPYAYVYLRDAALTPPMERFFSPSDYIFGPTDINGQISVSVPEGQYFLRVTRRNPFAIRPLGPPEPGDYSWTPIAPVSITANMVTELGTQYAGLFNMPIRISGVIKTFDGNPLQNRYVRAQTEPCTFGDDTTAPNLCGPVKLLAQQKTDAKGAYSIAIRNPGRYYIVVSQTLGPVSGQGNYQTTGKSLGNVTVEAGDDVIMPDTVYW
jgi:hypothetical protein